MPENKGNKKRKKRGSSGEQNLDTCKQSKTRGPSGGKDPNVSVSEILGQANSILYGCEDTNDSVFEACPSSSVSNMAPESNEIKDPTNADIIDYLKRIDAKLGSVENRISTIKKRLDGC